MVVTNYKSGSEVVTGGEIFIACVFRGKVNK
jgi:hypothetical protein